jgi:hypothetical protein
MQEFTREAQDQDRPVLEHIRELVAEEQRLLSDEDRADKERLRKIQVELDQYWDLLRQRRALRDVGENPDAAKLRDADTVERYEN